MTLGTIRAPCSTTGRALLWAPAPHYSCPAKHAQADRHPSLRCQSFLQRQVRRDLSSASPTAAANSPASCSPVQQQHHPAHVALTRHHSHHHRRSCRHGPNAATSKPVPYTLESLDFYAILGVMPTADGRTIRSAYHSLMRDLHPDRAAARTAGSSCNPSSTATAPSPTMSYMAAESQAQPAGHSSASTTSDLCVLINEIYEVLSDDERRATYDAISGFSAASINPFLDTSFARDQVFVDEVTCIGCGKCVRWAPGTFEIEASKYGRARVISQEGNTPEEVQIAIETCPVDCIHFVTLPQLSLLESVLATMARVDVFVMQRTQRSPGNVFHVGEGQEKDVCGKVQERGTSAGGAMRNRIAAREEAFKAHERRQAAINAMLAGKSRPKIDWDFWGRGSLEKEEREEAEQQATRDPAQRRIAQLAAAAARAARMWRAYLQSRAVLRTLADGKETQC